MFASIKSELIRFRRTGAIGGAVTIGLTLLVTMFLFIGIGEPDGGAGAGTGTPPGAAASIDLEASDGLAAGIESVAAIVGIVSLAMFALSIARDFELGTIRVLLVGQPRRTSLLGGKLLAIATIVASAALVAAVASFLLSLAIAGPNDVDTAAWTGGEAMSAAINFVIGTVGWGLVGATLAIVTRSASTAITGGVAYLLVGENLLGIIWDAATRWLPAGVIDAFTKGGTADLSYARSSVLLLLYMAVFVGSMLMIFQRRDIVD